MKLRRLPSASPLSLAVLALISTLGCVHTSDRKDALVHQRVAESYLSERNYTAALDELLKAVKLNPDDADIQFDLGVAYRGKGRAGEAIEHFRRAIELRPDFSEARNSLGVLYSGLGRFESAIQEFQTALKNPLYPTPENIHQNLSYTYYLRRDCENAYAESRKGLQYRQDHPVLLNSYALALHCLKRHKEAEEVFRQVIKINPDYVQANLNLANLLAETGQAEEAKKYYSVVLGLSPFTDEGRLARSRLEMLK